MVGGMTHVWNTLKTQTRENVTLIPCPVMVGRKETKTELDFDSTLYMSHQHSHSPALSRILLRNMYSAVVLYLLTFLIVCNPISL